MRTTPPKQLDKIFRLPYLPAVTLIFSTSFPYVWLSLLLVVAIHGLEVVTVIAPQCLRTNANYTYSCTDQVSSLDLSQGPVRLADVNAEKYIQPSAYWNRENISTAGKRGRGRGRGPERWT
jgi:hypothetical protein